MIRSKLLCLFDKYWQYAHGELGCVYFCVYFLQMFFWIIILTGMFAEVFILKRILEDILKL